MLAEKQKEIQTAKEHAGRKIDELESELRRAAHERNEYAGHAEEAKSALTKLRLENEDLKSRAALGEVETKNTLLELRSRAESAEHELELRCKTGAALEAELKRRTEAISAEKQTLELENQSLREKARFEKQALEEKLKFELEKAQTTH